MNPFLQDLVFKLAPIALDFMKPLKMEPVVETDNTLPQSSKRLSLPKRRSKIEKTDEYSGSYSSLLKIKEVKDHLITCLIFNGRKDGITDDDVFKSFFSKANYASLESFVEILYHLNKYEKFMRALMKGNYKKVTEEEKINIKYLIDMWRDTKL